MMDYLFLGVLVIIAGAFLYYSLFKKKGCGCGSKSCGTTGHTHETKEHSHEDSHECCGGDHKH